VRPVLVPTPLSRVIQAIDTTWAAAGLTPLDERAVAVATATRSLQKLLNVQTYP
jgi:hypothetical protein